MFSVISILTVLTEDAFGWGPVPNAYFFLGLAGFTLLGVIVGGQVLCWASSPRLARARAISSPVVSSPPSVLDPSRSLVPVSSRAVASS